MLVQKDRIALLRADAWRSLILIALFSAAIFSLLKNYLKPVIVYPLLVVLIWFDLGFVNTRYFTKDNYKRKRENSFSQPTAADQEILKDKGYYRVYNIQNPMAEARTSFFHNSLGGYHGAKLRRYQDLYDSVISKNTQQLFEDFQKGTADVLTTYNALNLLNAKYLVYGPDKENVILNPNAYGNAWFVKEVIPVKSPAEELMEVGGDQNKRCGRNEQWTVKNGQWTVEHLTVQPRVSLADHKPPYLKYESESSGKGIAVYSQKSIIRKGGMPLLMAMKFPILRANFILRALEVPAGKHVIEFKFEPRPYVVGNKVTMASGWLVAARSRW
jgi:hypothetical protein